MSHFPSWGWLELKVSIGELVLAVVTGASAWWVAGKLQKHQAADRALRNVTASRCRESLELLTALSDAIDEEFPIAGAQVGDDVRQRMHRSVQRLSNSIHTIEIAATEANLSGLMARIRVAKESLELLRSQALDPLVVNAVIDAGQIRQIEGTVRTLREDIIRVELAAVSE